MTGDRQLDKRAVYCEMFITAHKKPGAMAGFQSNLHIIR